MADPRSTNMLPPGFRFHPSEQQLLCYYLSNKKAYPAIPGDCNWIRELHDLRLEPSELQNRSWYSYGYKGTKRHWYFYTTGVWEEEKKTMQGYWKRSGKVRDVFNRRGVTLGTETSFVYFEGSPDTASRTDWVLYRYALANHVEGSFVVYRVFSRSDSDFSSCVVDANAGEITQQPQPPTYISSKTKNFISNLPPGVYHRLQPGGYMPESLAPRPRFYNLLSGVCHLQPGGYMPQLLAPLPRYYCFKPTTRRVQSRSCSEPVALRPLTSLCPLSTLLVNLPPEERRTMLGENLYPFVEALEKDKAAKVTGMLLELDHGEVLHLLESPEALKAIVAKAMDVLAKAAAVRPQ